MSGVELKSFRKFKNLCAQVGSTLEISTSRWSSFFPEFGAYFNNYAAYLSEPPGEYISPTEIKAILDQDKVVVINIQNIDFQKKTLVRCEGGGGHNICCIGYDENNLIFQDSNRLVAALSNSNSCGNLWTKTISIRTLQTGYETLLAAGLEARRL